MVERRIRTLLLLARMENSPHEAKELGLEDVSYIKDGFSAKGEFRLCHGCYSPVKEQ